MRIATMSPSPDENYSPSAERGIHTPIAKFSSFQCQLPQQNCGFCWFRELGKPWSENSSRRSKAKANATRQHCP